MHAPRPKPRPRTPPRQADEALQRLVGLLAACGYARSDIQAAATRALRGMPRTNPKRPALEAEFVGDAPHVITLWFQDPALLNAKGHPKPLPLHGAGLTLESLVRRLGRPQDPKLLTRYLRRIGGIRKVPGGWVPVNRYLYFKDRSVGGAVHALEGTLGYLRTSHRNVSRRRGQSPWFEARVTSRPISRKNLPHVDRLVRQLGHDYLATLDRRLTALEKRNPGPDAQIRVSIGSYYYEWQD